jgi:hypothetical protein
MDKIDEYVTSKMEKYLLVWDGARAELLDGNTGTLPREIIENGILEPLLEHQYRLTVKLFERNKEIKELKLKLNKLYGYDE